VRLQRRSIGLGHHEVVVGQAPADLQKLFGLLNAMGLQFCYDTRGQCDGARTAALGLFVAYAGLCLLGRLDDRQLAAGEIDIPPPQGGYLATPQATQDRKDHRNKYPLAPNGFDQFGSLSKIA